MFYKFLNSTTDIVKALDGQSDVAKRISTMATSLHTAIDRYGTVSDPRHDETYAYKVDGLGSHNLTADANITGLLSASLFGYLDRDGKVCQATGNSILSLNNPYLMRGTVINAVSGPYCGLRTLGLRQVLSGHLLRMTTLRYRPL